jgi:putative FmdB family regulatory protein
VPIYEYECEACGSELERFEMVPQNTPPVCGCKREGMRKLISSSAINMGVLFFGTREHKAKVREILKGTSPCV